MKKITDQELSQQARELSQKIIEAAKSSSNETELRLKTYPLFENFAQALDLNIESKHEYPLITGRADALYNRLIIEYKSPGVLQGDNAHKANQRAIEQTKGYILGLAEKQRKGSERFVAIVMDGCHLISMRFHRGRWAVDNPAPVNPASIERLLRLLVNLSYGRALIPDNLVADFGEDTPISRSAVSALHQALKVSQSPRVHTLYEQWRNQFSEVCDYDKASKLKVPELGLKFGIKTSEADPFPLFFSIHTYYAVFIKLLALQILRFYSAPGLGTDLMKVASFGTDELKSYMQKMEGGSIYHEVFGIANFLEADLFRWYLDGWDENIYAATRDIIAKLAQYSLQSLQQEHEEVRDLLKKLYHQLMPQRIRHNLGQYFTPDWLAERLLNMLEGGTFKGDPDTRLLDPSCGSGTFLVIAIEKIRNYAESKMLPEAEVLDKILQNIVGFDLDPLAIISARTNYLMALGDLIKYRKGDINIPVYLCDSILTPSEKEQDLFQKGKMQFTTSVGNFAVPISLVKAHYIDMLANLLEEAVNLELNKEQLIERIITRFPLLPDKDKEDIDTIYELYQKLLDLQKQGVNGIWARIIKNAFAPIFHRDFDYIAGNPPWVNWENLPENYRNNTAKLWFDYGLFEQKGIRAAFTKDDISIIMTYVAMDNYLKKKGKLGFVITQSVFKTELGGKGFRKFKIKNEIPVRVVHVDDMVELNPFEGASNRTSIVILQRDMPMKYPMPSYLYWKKINKGSIPTESELKDVLQMTKRLSWSAEPVNAKEETSSWLTGRPIALNAIKKVLGKSFYIAHEGVNSGGANAVYWVKILDKTPDGFVIIRNIIESAKRKAEQVEYAIEPDLLYPLLRGRDINRWKAQPSAYIILTHLPGMRLNAITEHEMKTKYGKTYLYLKKFKNILLERRGWEVKQAMKSGKPYWSMSEIGDYTFAPYRVVWSRIASNINAAVIDKFSTKIIIPQETYSLIATSNKIEVYYLCSVLNSVIFNFAAISYSQTGGKSFGSPHIIENIKIPKYDSSNKLHRELAELSQQAHQAAAEDKQEQVAEIEQQIDKLAARLWGLSDEEVNEITLSLKELILK